MQQKKNRTKSFTGKGPDLIVIRRDSMYKRNLFLCLRRDSGSVQQFLLSAIIRNKR